MRCLRKFEWVKLFRDKLPDGKGILGFWTKLAVKVAYRKGVALYCNYQNEVERGTWVGGIVGVKSILGVKSRWQAIEILDKLTELGYIEYEIDKETKKLTYRVLDLVLLCDGEDCGAVYAVNGYGFLCVPRTLTERKITFLKKRMRGWICGAIRYRKTRPTHFLFSLRPCSIAVMWY